jgi:hypothetical protein
VFENKHTAPARPRSRGAKKPCGPATEHDDIAMIHDARVSARNGKSISFVGRDKLLPGFAFW